MNPMRMKASAARRGEHALNINGAEIISKRHPNLSKSRFPSTNVLGTSLGELISAATDDQESASQVPALKAAGCKRMFSPKASRGRWDRPEFNQFLQLRYDDVLVIWYLGRLSRSSREVLAIVERLWKTGAGPRGLTEAIDMTAPEGRMMMQMVGAFAVRTGDASGMNQS